MSRSFLHQLTAKVALFAILFVSLAPTISHALALDNATGTQFFQQVCTSSGKNIVLNIKTTQGQQLDVTFAGESKVDTELPPLHHISHCPLCHLDVAKVILPSTDAVQALYAALLTFTTSPPAWLTSVDVTSSHTTRAPPAF